MDICRLRCGLLPRVRLLGAAGLGASWIFVGFDAGFYLVSASWDCWFRSLVDICGLGASWIFVGFDAGFYLVSASWGLLV